MRIISGKLKSRVIPALPERDARHTRPTTDIAKESLFNILHNWINLEYIQVLELFAGTGSVGLEFVSRGAKQVTFVEKFGPCVQFIKKTAQLFDVENQCVFVKSEVFAFLETHSAAYDVIFADPPYDLATTAQLPRLIFERNLLKPQGLLVIEHDASQNFESSLYFVESRQYGQAFFSFFQETSVE